MKCLSDPISDIRSLTATILGQIGNSQAVPALIECLRDNDKTVRLSVIEALENIGDISASNAIIQALDDQDEEVRDKSAEALGKIGTPETLAKLIEKHEILNSPKLFLLARKLAIRFSKEKVPFIPVYPELLGQSLDV